MKYMGSKARFSKDILPIILHDRKDGQWYVEPFCGGANVIDKVDGKRLGSDINPYVIELLTALSNGWVPPENVSEIEYRVAKEKLALDPITAFIGFGCSFGGKFFGGYARGKNSSGSWRNYASETKRNLLEQAPRLKGVNFRCGSYSDLEIPSNSIIYCDPPYEGTTKYATSCLDYIKFWQWCRDKSDEGHTVYVSEYNAPGDFECVWEKKTHANFDSGRSGGSERVERLFRLAK